MKTMIHRHQEAYSCHRGNRINVRRSLQILTVSTLMWSEELFIHFMTKVIGLI